MRLRISEKVVGSKLDKFGGGIVGKRKGSGESDGENLERMRSILSLKNWRNELASDCVSGVSGDELDGLRWRIEFKVFQSVRGLEDDSVTRFVRKLDLALEIRDLTKLHWALNFCGQREISSDAMIAYRHAYRHRKNIKFNYQLLLYNVVLVFQRK